MFGYTFIKKKELQLLKDDGKLADLLLKENLELYQKTKDLEKYVPARDASGKFCKK